jgi:hypothetical protein
MKKLSLDAICPCGSNKKYRHCCTKKNFEWLTNSKGKIYRRIPIHPEVKKLIIEQKKKFIRQFGRNPSANDPLFFDKISLREIDQTFAEVILKTGLDPAFLYAYQKTGLLVWEGNLSLLPDKDIKEWKAAVREFRGLQKQKPTKAELESLDFINYLVQLSINLDRAVVFLRTIVRDHGIARNIKTRRKVHSFHDFMLFCATKTLKSVTAIQLLNREGYAEDALSLTRSVYECYLRMTYLISHPGKINCFVAGRVRRQAGLCTRK